MKNVKKKFFVIMILFAALVSVFFAFENNVQAANQEEYAKRVDIDEILDDIKASPSKTRASSGDYRSWAQSDSRWASIKLGTSKYTMKSSGCLVTSVTKLVIQSGLRSSSKFTPGTMVTGLNANGGFTSGGGLYWAKPASLVSGFTYYGNLKEYGTYTSSKYNKQFVSWINEGYHMVVQVKDGGHWVAVDEKKTLETEKIYIMDSLPTATNINADLKLTDRYTTFNRVVAYKGGETPEVMPKNLTLEVKNKSEDGKEATLKLDWTKVRNYTEGYWIYRTSDKDDQWELLAEIGDGNQLEYLDDTVEPETTYYYKVQAFNSSKEGSKDSNVVEIKTQHVHSYKRTVYKKATTKATGKLKDTCTSCGHEKYVTILKIKEAKLSYKTYTYNGKVKTPKVTVTNTSGKEIKDSYYTVTYGEGRKKVGTYTVTIEFKGRYKGTITKEFKIVPKKPSVTKLTVGKKYFKINWEKVENQVSGYEIKWSTSKNFSYNYKSKNISYKYGTSKVTVARSNTRYYAKVRTYKKVNGVTYYSGWSEVNTFVSK